MDGYMSGRKKDPKTWRDVLIDPKELALYEENRLKKREETFNKVLLQCSRKIQYELTRHSETMCSFEIPEFVQGSPKYDVMDCAEWLIRRLREKDYDVEFARPCHLVISWARQISMTKRKIEEEHSRNTRIRKVEQEPIVLDEDSGLSRIALRAKLLKKKKEAYDKR